MGLPLHVMSTSSSLNTFMPSLVETETLPLLAVLPKLIKDVGKSWNVSACINQADSLQNELGDIFCLACAAIGDPNPSC